MGVRYFGAEVRRVEDPRLITGQGRYLDDLNIPGVLHAGFVRAAHAHARILGIDCGAARKLPGVVAVYTAADLGELAHKPMPHTVPVGNIKQPINYQPLAQHEVCHVGVPVVVVIAESRSIAEDAAALVEVDYEVLEAVVDWRRALDPDAPRVHRDTPDNLVASLHGRFGAVEEIFANAPHVFAETFVTHRGGCHSMEGRGVAVMPDPIGDGLTVWTSTQMPHMVRRLIADHLGRDERTVRVIAPDVGGGFGPKGVFYPEEVVLPLAALKLQRPVKWVEDRSEHFVATAQQRDQEWALEVAADDAGRLLGVRGRCLHDNGGYVPYGARRRRYLAGRVSGTLCAAGCRYPHRHRFHQSRSQYAGARCGTADHLLRAGAPRRPRRARIVARSGRGPAPQFRAPGPTALPDRDEGP
jgi:carbon-monoxide dehydrogenase large subunit